MKQQVKLKRKRVSIKQIVEHYGLGKPINYEDCWECWRFQKFQYCYFRIWIEDQLYCFLPSRYIDDRLKA